MKLPIIVLLPFAALVAGCPDEEKKDPSSAPSAPADASTDGGNVADAGRSDAAAPKK